MIHLDANVLIALTNDDTIARRRMAKYTADGEEFYVSSVTWYEFLAGPVLDHQIDDMRILLNSDPLPFDSETAKEAADLFNKTGRARKRKTDTMIAATALLHGGKLATRNVQDFQCFESHGLELIEV